jgi:hypothetical protein
MSPSAAGPAVAPSNRAEGTGRSAEVPAER